MELNEIEQKTRKRLGIPKEAKKVLIFSESSHWDPNWLKKAEEYFNQFVCNNLNQAIIELKKEPRRIYSIECIFFLRMFWEKYPEKQEILRDLINKKQIRITNIGVTTADTILPSTEAILRDFLVGQEWLRINKIEQEPKLAYFADSFGCTPALPSILKATGFKYTTLTRVDGMYFMGCDLEPQKNFPRPNSTAEKLLKKEKSLDFVWKDMNGAQVLCHWNAFSYGQGDMLAYIGVTRVYLFRIALSFRSNRHIAKRVKQYVKKLYKYSKTPYMLCPIGFDFVEPIPDLIMLLDRYNQKYYKKTGIWVVNAGMEDYFELISHYQDKLPKLEIDPNPYWTGFYTSRPLLKKQCKNLVDKLILTEKLSFLPGNSDINKKINSKLKEPWWQAVTSNHHDFITGTSPDKVVEEEQMYEVVKATNSVDLILKQIKINNFLTEKEQKKDNSMIVNQKSAKIYIKTKFFEIELSKKFGTILSIKNIANKTIWINDISNNLISYRDSGGLWRMGFEFIGGIWKESKTVKPHILETQLIEHNIGVEIINIVNLSGEIIRQKMFFVNESPVIYCRIEGKAAKGHSIIVRLKTNIFTNQMHMDTTGGIIKRPIKRIYNPTFWSFQSFTHLKDEKSKKGFAILQPIPGAISYQEGGVVEIVALRNATQEKIFGLISIPGNPVKGHEKEKNIFEYSLLFTNKGDWKENNINNISKTRTTNPWVNKKDIYLNDLANSIFTTNSPKAYITAVKPASRGKGIIIRINTLELMDKPIKIIINHYKMSKAFLCDVRERDLSQLDIKNGIVVLKMPGTIATIRLIE